MVVTSIPAETHIEVWCPSTNRWVPGFRVGEVRPDGSVVVLGRDGGGVLPERIDLRRVRPSAATTPSPWANLRPSSAMRHHIRSR